MIVGIQTPSPGPRSSTDGERRMYGETNTLTVDRTSNKRSSEITTPKAFGVNLLVTFESRRGSGVIWSAYMRRAVSLFVIVSLTFNPPGLPCFANPTGGTVVGGDRNGTIGGSGTGTTTINQHGNRIIINWQDFSIGQGEVTRFIQPSGNSWALNRVISGNPSLIYGSLEANGHVLVINQNGIMVGASGKIDTKGFFASTLDLKDSSFMKGGKLTLSGDSTASVRNDGTINALGGDVFLIGNTVENSGTISAPQGTVGLAAGSSVRLVPAGNERISVLAGNANGTAANGVHNVGTIQGASAELKAAGGNIYALAINNEGVVRANSVVNEGGHVYLRASGGNIENSGTISAHNADGSGGTVIFDGGHYEDLPTTVVNSGTIDARGDAAGTKGGTVVMTGDHVGLFDHAVVDVSGDSGGGTALIGGDTHGANANVRNAERTYVSADAIVRADGLSLGDGGKIVIWANDVTRYFGNVSARGGTLGGDGGFAEISGKNSLVFHGNADLQFRGQSGSMGKLLLDPKNIIVATADPGGGAVSESTAASLDQFADNPTETSWITPTDLQTLLNGGNVTFQANNDISFRNAVTATAGNGSLTLRAGRSIEFLTGASLTLHGTGAFSATYNDSGATLANRDAGVATFTMASGTTISAAGGITILGSTLVGAAGDATIASLTTAGPADTAVTTHGDVSVNTGVGGGNITAGSIVTAGAALTSNNGNGNDAGTVSLTGANVTVGSIDSSGGNGRGSNRDGGTGKTVTLAAAGTLTVNGAITANGGTRTGSGTIGQAGGINLSGASVAIGGNLSSVDATAAGGGTITLNADTSGASQTAGSMTAANLLLTGAGTFNLNQANNVGTLAGNVNGAVTYRDVDQLHIGDVGTTHGLNAGNNAISITTVNGNLTVDNTTAGNDIDAGTSTITLTAQSDSSGGAQDNAVVIASSANIHGGGGVSLIADHMTLTGTIDAGTSTASLRQFENGTLISLTGSEVAGTLALSSTELNHVTAGVLKIGDANSGNLSIVGAIAPANATTLSLQSGGSINQTAGTVGSVATPLGNLALRAGGSITLNQANHVGTVAASAGGAIQYNDADNLTIASVDGVNGISANNNNITITTGTGDLTINDTAAVNDVNAGNGSVSLNAGGAGKLLTISSGANVTGNGGITLIADDMDLSGTVNTLGVALLHPDTGLGARNITLGTTVAGTLNLSGSEINNVSAGTLQIGDANSGAIAINGAIHPLNAANLSLQSRGTITESAGGSLIVSGTTTLNSSGVGPLGNISLDQTGNDFGTVTVTDGNDVTIRDDNGIILGGLGSVSGNLNVTAGGNISQSGALILNGVGQTATFTVTAANSDILLGNQPNDFTAVNFAASGVGSIHNLALQNINATPANPTLPGGLNDLTLIFPNAAVTLPTFSLSGNLIVTAGGNISQSGAILMGGPGQTATFTAGSHNINLGNIGNDFGVVSIVSGNDVTLTDANRINLGASTIAGNLNVTALNGPINGIGPIVMTGGATKTATFSASGLGNDIFLTDPNNDFTTILLSGGNVNVRDVNDLRFGASSISGNLFVTANGAISQNGAIGVSGLASFSAGSTHDITLGNGGNDFSTISIVSGNNVTLQDANGINFGASTISGDLNVTANGPISQTGAIIANGTGKTATFAAGAGNTIFLDNSGNDFSTVSITSGSDVKLADANSIDLGASTASASLEVTAHGNITESGALHVTSGPSTFTVDSATGDVLLGNQANDFGNQSVTISAVNGGSVRDVALRNVNPAAAFPLLPFNMQDLTIHFDTAPIFISSSFSLSGNLDLSAGGPISQFFFTTFSVNGTTTLAAGSANDINLFFGNDYGGAVNVVSGNNVTLNDINGLTVGGNVNGNLATTAGGPIVFNATTVGGNLTANGGGLSDSGNVNVTGTSALNAGGGNISFTHADNFGGAVSLANANDVTLNDVDNLTVGGNVGGNLTTTAGGALAFNTLTVGGNLNASGNGLSDLGIVNITGTSALNAGGGDILFTLADNFGGAVTIANANNVTLNDVNNLTVGGSVGGNLTTTAGGPIAFNALTVGGNLSATGAGLSDNGNVNITGTSALNAGGGDILFTHADNFGGAVSVANANNVTLNDVNGLTVGGTVGGNLTAIAAGALALNALSVGGNLVASGTGVSDNGDVSIAGTTALNAGGGNVSFTHSDNFGGAVSLANANNVTLNDVNNLTVGGTVGGNLTTTAGGALAFNALNVGGNLIATGNGLSDNGSVSIAGTSTMNAGGGDVSFTHADDFGGAVSIANAHNVTLNDVNGIDLGSSSASGTFSVTAGGDITDSGDLLVAGNAAFKAGDGRDIILDESGNTFNGTVNFSSSGTLHDVTVVDTTAFDIAAITVGGTLKVSSGGDVTQSGAITSPNLLVQASAGNVTLNNNGNNVGTLAIDANGTVQFTETAGKELTIGEVDGIKGISSQGNNITINADDLNIVQNIDARGTGTPGDVLLQPVSAGRNIHFGDDQGVNALNLSQNELNRIFANHLTIGNLSAGDVTGGHAQPPGVIVNPISVVAGGLHNDFDVVVNQLGSVLAGAILPVPRLEVTSFSGSGIDAAEAAKIMEPDAIGTLFLQVPFVPVEEKKYKVEEISKWTAGRIAASGTTAGPQSPR